MSTPRTARSRLVGALIAAVSVTAAMLIAPAASAAPQAALIAESAVQSPVPSTVRPAANLALFNPGHIISDALFFNSGTMTEAQIQAFITSKSPNCRAGYVCLKDWRDTSRTTAADAMCGPYQGAANERASTIIYKVARACGINPQVILATLEKEQSLVSHTWPSTSRFTIAMGQGCPDTAACDTRYYGFFNQVFGAAWQLKRYANPPGTSQYFTWYAPGRTWNVRYNPNAACGSAPVFIQNQATANLYYYTPYQPNRAALAAGYGLGDGCSSYGNRNFYQFFNDWFGSTSYAVTGVINDYWSSVGGAAGYIGEPTSAMRGWSGQGWSQTFSGANLYLKSGARVQEIGGAIRTEYNVVGQPASGLGWAVENQLRQSGGWYQHFEGGRIWVRPDGRGVAVAAPMYGVHIAEANVDGWLGWPASRAVRVADGSQQDFDGGTIFAGPRFTVPLPKRASDAYRNAGGPAGIGWPTAGLVRDAAGERVDFDRGALQWSTTGALTVVKGAIGAAYAGQGGSKGALGVALGNETYDGTGWRQNFRGGSIYVSASGTFIVSALRDALEAAGGVKALGYPSAAEKLNGSSASQDFGAVTLGKGPNGAFLVKGAIGSAYRASGAVTSALGAPTGPERFGSGGWFQDFERGRLLCGPGGTFILPAQVLAKFDAAGGVAGRLGWPTSAARVLADGWEQTFQGGRLLVPSVGGDAGGVVTGGILPVYVAAGASASLGYPVSAESLVPGAWRQVFQRGVVYLPSGTPSLVVSGKLFEVYRDLGLDGAVGLPRAAQVNGSGGSAQEFGSVTIYTSPAGSFATTGVVRQMFHAAGGPAGVMGWPTAAGTGSKQTFQNGVFLAGPAGAFAVMGSLGREYLARGAETGALGWPIAQETLVAGVLSQRFQNGTLTRLPDGSFQIR